MVITIKDIERKEFEEWQKSCRKEVWLQIILNEMKKRKSIKKETAKRMQERINKLGEENLSKIRYI